MRKLILAVAVGLLGCHASSDAVAFVHSYNQLRCNYALCAAGQSPAAAQKTCSALASFQAEEANIAKGADAGRVSVDPKKSRACLAALAPYAASCWGQDAPHVGPQSIIVQACSDVLVGTVDPGGNCYDSAECRNGYCDATLDMCPGRCQVRRVADTVCAGDVECVAGLVCSSVGGTGHCAILAATGESCSNTGCQSGLVCAAGTCAVPVAGMACTQDECGDALFCSVDPLTNKGTCASLVKAGGACTQSNDCAGLQLCFPGAGGMPGVCGAPEDVGSPCGSGTVPGASTGECFNDLSCDPTTSKCAPPPTVGQSCVSGNCDADSYCASGMGTASVCTALRSDGASCQTATECKGVCSGGLCQDALVVTGECLAP